MSMTTWNPITDIETIRSQFDRLFNQMWAGAMPLGARPEAGRLGLMLPAVEIYTSADKQLVVKAELPGISIDDVTAEIVDDRIHLAGETKRTAEVVEEQYYRSERQFGRFERTIPLPLKVKADQARATFKDGVLTIKAPLAEEAKRPGARKLTVEQQ